MDGGNYNESPLWKLILVQKPYRNKLLRINAQLSIAINTKFSPVNA